MNKRLTTDIDDANGLQRTISTYRIFQHQENGRQCLQRAMRNGQYWVLKEFCIHKLARRSLSLLCTYTCRFTFLMFFTD